MPRKPEAYKTPLRKRVDIAAWIVENTDQRFYDHEKCPFCFNVKVYSVNFDFDYLLKIYREEQDGNEADDWLPEARERWEKHKDEHLWEWALEDCRSAFDDTDCYNHLWDGTPVNVTYSFRGRQGGWLSLDQFQGNTFASRDSDFPEALAEMSYKELRQLYALIAMLKYDLRRTAIVREVEYKAAWALFVNVCSDLTDKEYPQKKFPFMEPHHELRDICRKTTDPEVAAKEMAAMEADLVIAAHVLQTEYKLTAEQVHKLLQPYNSGG